MPQPDPVLVKDQLQALQATLKAYGPTHFMASMFWILAKTKQEYESIEDSIIIPFKLHRIQLKLEEDLARNNLLVKPRQVGSTTYFELRRLLLPAITEGGIGSLLISQNDEYAVEHFNIARRAYRLVGAVDPYHAEMNKLNVSLRQNLLHTAYSNRRELIFDQLESKVRIASAEVEESGQGMTLHHILADEYSRWPGKPEDTLSNVRGALIPGGTVDKACTANGAAGPFYEDVLRALYEPQASDAKLHFFGWWWQEEYQLELSPEQAAELDLKSDEQALVKKFHAELEPVAWARDLNRIAWRRQTKLEQKANFDEKYPEDVLTAFLVTGNQYFDRQIVIQRKQELTGFKPFQMFSDGAAQLLHPRIPTRRYLIGADPAKGRSVTGTDTDYAAAVVIDLESAQEMASYRARIAPEDFAYDLADLGRYYNHAVIAVERTGDGGTVILVLKGDCRYDAIYKHKDWWKRERKVVEFEGFPTTRKTRPVALNFLNRFVSEHPEQIWDQMFLQEALTFVRDEKGIPRAAPGAHDDAVSCRWIAHYCRLVLLGYYDPIDSKSEQYVDSSRLTGVET